jgi:hypothetical protein
MIPKKRRRCNLCRGSWICGTHEMRNEINSSVKWLSAPLRDAPVSRRQEPGFRPYFPLPPSLCYTWKRKSQQAPRVRPGRNRGKWTMSTSVKLTADMQRILNEQRLGFVASVCEDGTPNLSPKGTTAVWDDEHIVFADICSPGTIANLRHHPVVEINVVDPVQTSPRMVYRFRQ